MGEGKENRFCVFPWAVRDETEKCGVDDGSPFQFPAIFWQEE